MIASRFESQSGLNELIDGCSPKKPSRSIAASALPDSGFGIAIEGRAIVITGFAKRHDHVEPIDRATLKDRDQRLSLAAGERVAQHDAFEKRRRRKRHAQLANAMLPDLRKNLRFIIYCL